MALWTPRSKDIFFLPNIIKFLPFCKNKTWYVPIRAAPAFCVPVPGVCRHAIRTFGAIRHRQRAVSQWPESAVKGKGERSFCAVPRAWFVAEEDGNMKRGKRKGTVLDYLRKYGRYSFREMPMTDVDSLALCQLAYLKFDGMVPGIGEGRPAVTLRDLKAHPCYEDLFADARFEKENRALMEGMLAGKRFRNLKLNFYVNVVEKQWETQFSAVTFLLNDGMVYVAYRGTDETIVGWKEDFNMAFLSPVPGQAYGVRYLDRVASGFQGAFCVGGHSKGGNLAVYSAMNCRPEIQERIVKVFSMDGPGFRPEVMEDCNYGDIADKVVKILPHSSLVGMLFESDVRFRVVESKSFGLLQHDPFNWQVEGNHLKRAEDLLESRKRMDNRLNRWMLSRDPKQMKRFVDALFEVIFASKAENLIDFAAEWRRSVNGILTALRGLDDETAGALRTVARSLFGMAGAQVWEGIARSARNVIVGTRRLVTKSRAGLSHRIQRFHRHPGVPGAIGRL